MDSTRRLVDELGSGVHCGGIGFSIAAAADASRPVHGYGHICVSFAHSAVRLRPFHFGLLLCVHLSNVLSSPALGARRVVARCCRRFTPFEFEHLRTLSDNK